MNMYHSYMLNVQATVKN